MATKRWDDDESHDKTTFLSLSALEERRKEITARLRVTTSALRDAGAVTNGYESAFFLEPPSPDFPSNCIHERFFRRHRVIIDDALWQKLCAQRFAFDPPDRDRFEWRINDLGREKCRELWQLFDVDGDGVWNYEDFVEYMTAMDERVGTRDAMHAIADHEEVWRMVMSDRYEIDETQSLTFEGFLRYREATEDQYPLLIDLKAMDISVEWRAVEKMRHIVDVINEYFGQDEVVPFKYVQYLLAECGTVVTYKDLWQTIQRQRLFHRCHRFILSQKRALRLFGYKQKTAIQLTSPALEEDSRVCRAGCLALMLSGWIPKERTTWRRFFLHARLRSYELLRRAKRRVSLSFDWIKKAARTGLLRASCLQSTQERELGDYVFKVDVGSNFTAHSTINATYYSDADSAATLHELKYLERGAECFFFVDFVTRPGTREADAQLLIQKLTWFVELFLKEHLELLPFFFKWFITIPSKMQLRVSGGGGTTSAAGTSPVIRFVVLFTGEMDLYEVMQSLNLPSAMQFDHLLQRLSMRWMFSHSIEEMVTNKRFVAGSQWSCRGQLNARFNRQAWGQILRQCAMQMNDEIMMEQEEQEFMASQRRQQDQKTTKTTNVDTNETTHQSQDVARQWIEWLHRVAILVDSSKELSLSWTFRDLRSLLEDYAWIKTVISSSTIQRLRSLLSAGALANEWKTQGESFRAEFASSQFVETTIAANTASAFPPASAAGIQGTPICSAASASADGRQEPTTARRQPRSRQSSITGSFPFASNTSTPSSARPLDFGLASSVLEETDPNGQVHLKKEEEDPLEYELLELYEMCVKTLQSVHSMRAEAGTTGVTIAFEGWNVFSILPRIIPSTVGRRSMVRTRSTMSNSSETAMSIGTFHLSTSELSTTTASSMGGPRTRPGTQY